MGWWSTNKEGHSFAENDGNGMVWGDAPADVIDNAVAEIVKIFREDWGRPPIKDELIAGVRFSLAVYDEEE